MSTRTAVIYTRVSSREQELEGFSLDAQSKLLREYAERNGLQIVQAFEDVETAKTTGRKQFGEMIAFLQRNRRTCRTLLVEKTDRLYRNFKDAVTLEELDIEIHFVKESQILSKDSKSQIKFMHDIRLAVARNYSENLREEVKKGMQEKASQGIYPGRPPFGYRNNEGTRSIEIHPEKAAIAKRVFELYAAGFCSLLELSKTIRGESGVKISKTNLHKMLTNPFLYWPVRVGWAHICGDTPPAYTPAVVFRRAICAAGVQQAQIRKTRICVPGSVEMRSRSLHGNGGTQEGQIRVLPVQRGTGPL